MFRFTLCGRVLRKLVYIGHTILVIEADPANASAVSCIVRDERLKEAVDCKIRTGTMARSNGITRGLACNREA
ncbi:MAG: hypothetical protein J0L81_08880 [Caulobacterales bacterium]|jgi:hypothetical protein|nr:hypothetical protein [Caulobacterales bacterium]